MKIPPDALRHIVFGLLTESQKLEACGTFSGDQLPTNFDATSPTNPINIWFAESASPTARKLILHQDDIVALLVYYDGYLQVVSAPDLQMDMNTQQEFIVGHLGDNVDPVIPIAFNPHHLVTDFYGLLPGDTATDNTLTHLKSRGAAIDETVPDGNGGVTTFLANAPNVTIPGDVVTEGTRVSCLPVAIPLPRGHGITATDWDNKEALTTLRGSLTTINPILGLWLDSLDLTITIFEGKSLQCDYFSIHDDYLQGLKPNAILRPTIAAKCQPIRADSPMAKNLMAAKNNAFANNFDKWCNEHPDVYEEITAKFIGNPAPTPLPAPPQNAPPYQSRADKNSENRCLQVTTFLRTLLGTKSTAANGKPIVIPADIHPAVITFLEDTSPRSGLSNLQHHISIYMDTRQNVGKIMAHDTSFASSIVTTRFATSLHAGQFSAHPLQHSLSQTDRYICIFSMLRQYTHSEDYQASLIHEYDLRDEYLLGETGTNATKVDTKLGPQLAQNSYRDLYTALANVHAFLSFLANIAPTDVQINDEPFLLHAISQLYDTVRTGQFEEWFDWAKNKQDAAWLCHSLLSDAHTIITDAVKFARDPSVVESILNNRDIDGSLLTKLETNVTSMLGKWGTGLSTQSLGHFISPPSTLPSFIKTKKEKDQAKRDTKRQKTETHSNGNHQGTANSIGNSNNTGAPTGVFGNYNRSRGSDPNKGFIKVTPPNAIIPNGPRVSGKVPCGNFIMQGRSCPGNCGYDHVSFQNLKPEDIPAYTAWVDANPALSWARGSPPARGNSNTEQTQSNQQKHRNTNRPARSNNQEQRG
jgi:hypothetical protein